MLTTALNPTVWLLVATMVAAIVGAVRGRDAREVVGRLERLLCAGPVLTTLCLLAAFGLGSRTVLGFLSPGAYAEEVVAARSFLEQGGLYGANGRGELSEWIADTPAVPWNAIPGVTPCQANAISNRALFYTEHAHTPMLLLAGVPIVRVAGGRGLYVALASLSIGAVIAIWTILSQRAGIPWRSRQGLLVLAAIAGWQPVLAGIRQGDAVLPAAGLVVIAWHLAGRRRSTASAISAAVASCIALPAAGGLPAIIRSAPGAAWPALAIVVAAAGGTVALTGSAVIPAFVQTMAETARTYAGAVPNYAVLGRFMTTGHAHIATAFMAIVLACSWWRARTNDAAFAIFSVAGLLAAPVLWSQHLALVIVPAAVLFASVATSRPSLGLAAWSLLVLCFSLPDPAVARLLELAAPISFTDPLPVVPFALVTFWTWTTFSRASSPVAPHVEWDLRLKAEATQ